jgi:F1F0 ATPase subunit 2
MERVFQFVLIFLAGTALGLCFFGGLAWTVRRLVAGGGFLLALTSFLLRALLLIAAFYLLARTHAESWIACLLGFTAARLLLQRPRFLQCAFVRREGRDASHD